VEGETAFRGAKGLEERGSKIVAYRRPPCVMNCASIAALNGATKEIKEQRSFDGERQSP
jgi:hypothetical protein